MPIIDREQNAPVFDHVAGPVFLAVSAAAYNAVAGRRGKPTISTGIRWVVRQYWGPEIAGAVFGGLLAHWLLKETRSWI